jgi:ABC-2 type transport system ATP-binding protein
MAIQPARQPRPGASSDGPLTDRHALTIDTHDLRKTFGTKVAVRRLTLAVPRGSVFGFLGPNGAGKSTSIKMLLGLARPTAGRATVLGQPAGEVATRRRIGFLPEHFRFYEWLTPIELLTFHGRLSGLSAGELKARVPRYVDLVGLTPHRDRQIGGFSKGMLQRVGLAQALIHQPDLIFLDEPTSDLDPMGRRLARDLIRAERDRGATVFLNSHLLGEVEVTCDQVAFIKDGEVVAHHDLGHDDQATVRVAIRIGPRADGALDALRGLATQTARDGDRLVVTVASGDRIPEVVRRLAASGAEIYEVTPQKTSLEELFLTTIGEDRGL